MISETAASSARERLLAAADKLFYEEGINTVGIDRVIEEAGVAKASLYTIFGSKEQLIVAYLRRQLEHRMQDRMRALEKIHGPRDRIPAVFDVLDAFIRTPRFNGCAFVNASAESPRGSAVAEAARESLSSLRALFTELARDFGVADPEVLARQLVMLYDGALVSSWMDDDLDAATTARAAAAALSAENAVIGARCGQRRLDSSRADFVGVGRTLDDRSQSVKSHQ